MQQPWIVIAATRDAALADALACARLLTSLDHVVVVASSQTAPAVTAQLAWYPSVELVVETRSLGTAIELLHPLAAVLERDPLASIVFVPTDCRIAGPKVLAEALDSASYAIAGRQIALLGPTTLDWSADRAAFIAAGLVTTFWDLARCALPKHTTMFERYVDAIGTPAEERALDAAFATLPRASLGRDLLARARRLAMVPFGPQSLQLHVLSLGPQGVLATSQSSRRAA